MTLGPNVFFISSRTWRASFHCWPFSQADMSAEKVTTVGRTPSLFISSNISKALDGLSPFSQAEMAVNQ